MKRIKSVLAFLVLGFLAFAPPGTLIGLFLLLTALTGNVWIVISAILLTAIAGLGWLVYQSRVKRAAVSKGTPNS